MHLSRTLLLSVTFACGASNVAVQPEAQSSEARSLEVTPVSSTTSSPGTSPEATDTATARDDADHSGDAPPEPVDSEWTDIAASAMSLAQHLDEACHATPTRDGALLRRTRGPATLDESGPLPQRVLRTLTPDVGEVFLLTSSEMCRPRAGTATAFASHARFSEVTQRLGGCRRASTFAYSECTLPEELRYERLQYRIHRVRSDEEVDARARELFVSQDDIAAALNSPSAGWASELRRRWRVASVRTAQEEVAFMETHWQVGDPEWCPSEGMNSAVFTRQLPDGPWERVDSVTTFGVPVGVYHDGERVLGVETYGPLVDGRDGLDCGGASDCEASSFAVRDAQGGFAAGFTRTFGFTSGNYALRQSQAPLSRYGLHCEP